MRESFERSLRLQNDVIKDIDLPYTKELGDLIEDIALSLPDENKSVKEIFLLQIEKRNIMDRLKRDITCLDNPECVLDKVGENDLELDYDKVNDIFIYTNEDGSKKNLTFGDIASDLEWGMFYYLKKDTPRRLYKRYLIESAKKEIFNLLNDQILEQEINNKDTDPKSRFTFSRIRNFIGNSILNNKSAGIFYEKMVIELLKKVQFDNNTDFEIENVDVYTDVKRKIDFIINFKSRGKKIGIQFSTTKQEKNIEKKKQQLVDINRYISRHGVSKILFVLIDTETFSTALESWIRDNKPVGGPIQYLNNEAKLFIIKTVMNELIEDSLINESQLLKIKL